MDRLVKEDAVVEELVDMVVVDVRIVAEDLMALKMRLLVVYAVVRLIEEDMDMNVGVDVGMGVVELVMLIDSSLLMLLRMATTTTNSLLFWPFHIKRLEASCVWLVEGRVQRLPKGGARHIKLTDDMQAFIRDEQEKLYNSLSPPSPRLVRNWQFASQTRQFQTQP